MEQLQKQLDPESYQKLSMNKITYESLMQLNDDDLIEMNIREKGPRKLIITFIEKNKVERNVNENAPDNLQQETIRSILAKEPKFQKTLTRQLDYEIVPDTKGLLHLNRILTNHFFEARILQERRYPSWQEKQKLAEQIIEAFPHLDQTRVNAQAPRESFFFWKNGGKGKGPHLGIIETRCSNMRKDVSPENRLFQRPKKSSIVIPEGIHERAVRLAIMTGNTQNAKIISDEMMHCFPLHQYLLQNKNENVTQEIITTFPHLLGYNGMMIQQAYERLHINYNKNADLEKFLSIGLLMDQGGWNNITDKCLRGALRIMKKLTNRGIKRFAEESTSMSLEEITAAPLVRWLKPDLETTPIQRVKMANLQNTALPHIACVAEKFQEGTLFLVVYGHIIECGSSSIQAIDAFFKAFDVLGAPVPVLLRKLYDFISVHLYKTLCSSGSTKVAELSLIFEEYEKD
ncbi:uncharacterized protein LOC128736178 [Sabethes cyaneus]|uniref:uncharacterized protein LOC128736178 n=1 Tax=Sabethes cyaneus TaxID=53552 RepID=UPI00237ED416|nr:uncharacterized protein LOC128736178 [Sabethes cyaneus]